MSVADLEVKSGHVDVDEETQTYAELHPCPVKIEGHLPVAYQVKAS